MKAEVGEIGERVLCVRDVRAAGEVAGLVVFSKGPSGVVSL